jgi:hypothetical protein
MIITLKGPPDYILCDGPQHGANLHVGPLEDIRNSIRANMQVDEILRGSAVSIISRQNLSGSLVFSVISQRANMGEAAKYVVNYPYTLPRIGEVWITEGSRIIKLTAGIPDVSVVQIGISVRITYNIVYGSVAFVN